MQLEVERHMPLRAVTLLDAASAYPISEPSISTMEALGLHTPHPVRLSLSSWSDRPSSLLPYCAFGKGLA
jgi:hypothetical protein